MLACMALGADGVQIGSRFVASYESSAHVNFKKAVINTKEGETELTLKELTPVRLMKNEFHSSIKEAYSKNASIKELSELLGRGRAKKGMFEGDLKNGELEIGQIAGLMDELLSAEQIIIDLVKEFNDAQNELSKISMK